MEPVGPVLQCPNGRVPTNRGAPRPPASREYSSVTGQAAVTSARAAWAVARVGLGPLTLLRPFVIVTASAGAAGGGWQALLVGGVASAVVLCVEAAVRRRRYRHVQYGRRSDAGEVREACQAAAAQVGHRPR